MKMLVALLAMLPLSLVHGQECPPMERSTDAFTGVSAVAYPSAQGNVLRRDSTVYLELPFTPRGTQRLREGDPLDLILMDRRLVHLTMSRVALDGRHAWATMVLNADESRWLSWTPILSVQWHTSEGRVQARLKERDAHRLKRAMECLLKQPIPQ